VDFGSWGFPSPDGPSFSDCVVLPILAVLRAWRPRTMAFCRYPRWAAIRYLPGWHNPKAAPSGEAGSQRTTSCVRFFTAEFRVNGAHRMDVPLATLAAVKYLQAKKRLIAALFLRFGNSGHQGAFCVSLRWKVSTWTQQLQSASTYAARFAPRRGRGCGK
jgi:hypothetical protein